MYCPATKRRFEATIDAIRGQAADIRAIIEPLLPAVESDHMAGMPDGDLPAALEYIHYLYRDWGWPAEPNGETQCALAAVDQVFARLCGIGAGLVLASQ
jgi:hypothetical protein